MAILLAVFIASATIGAGTFLPIFIANYVAKRRIERIVADIYAELNIGEEKGE